MRWTARLLGLLAIALFALFIYMSGAQVLPALSWTDPQGMPLMLFLVIALAGVLLAWRWQLVGGLMTTGGAAAIIALVCGGSGFDMFLCGLFFTLPLLVTGALHLGCCWRTKAVARSQAA
jgi:hypothetical protein